jgi:hypothetical protein
LPAASGAHSGYQNRSHARANALRAAAICNVVFLIIDNHKKLDSGIFGQVVNSSTFADVFIRASW